jgi:nicotinate-nucleotide adenylyltransferase
MKIGILGGTFDPIHLGHLKLAQNAQAQVSLDKVIFVPAYQPPHKKEFPSLASAADRYEMVRLAIEGKPFLELSDCELKRGGVSYTWDTIAEFERKYPGDIFYLILGKDAFDGIDTWHHAAGLKKKVRFLVAKRSIGEIFMPEDPYVEWIRMPLCPISASGIREAMQQGRNVDAQVPPEVLQFIRANALYRKR